MSQQPALAGLRDALNLRLEELNAAIKEHDGKDRDDPTCADTHKAMWDACEAYSKAYEVWNEEKGKEVA